jgi:hypothetical protein
MWLRGIKPVPRTMLCGMPPESGVTIKVNNALEPSTGFLIFTLF